MKFVCEENRCAGCMACIEVCAKKAIDIEDKLYAYNAVIDENKCVDCGLCRRVCPRNNRVEKVKPIDWHEGWAESNIRAKSSSGGAASAIIKTFIEEGGYVAACLFEKGKFVFRLTNDLDVAKKFSGSKYVKSNPIGIYKEVKDTLQSGKRVLFIGLPCQVAALINIVGSQDQLYTIDLICHGTPSPKILDAFLREKQIDIKNLDDIQFRENDIFGIRIKGQDTFSTGVQDLYTAAFLTALDYTENCYSCSYATLNRVSDITLGDSWGTDLEESEQKKGISLLLCQTAKGQELICKAGITIKNVNLDKAVQANAQLRKPSTMPENRKVFFDNLNQGFHKAMAKSNAKLYYKKKIKEFFVKIHLIGRKG